MEKYKVLEHTADLMIQAFGATLGELFENAAIGMCEQVVEKKVLTGTTGTYPIEVNLFGGIENIFRDFLNIIKDGLYDFGRYPIFLDFYDGVAVVHFEEMDRDKSVFCDEIKAVTFCEMLITREILEEKWWWQTKIVFDV